MLETWKKSSIDTQDGRSREADNVPSNWENVRSCGFNR